MRDYFVYILSNKTDSTLYIGVTNDLLRRVWEHKEKSVAGFTAKYNVNKLVYYEVAGDVDVAIAREKQLKGWNRRKKEALIDAMNPEREDLWESIL
ncbi:GIY-YIG nuclease superfamily protein [Aedoeadaptatus ivorii]|uniref:GIY-YIG nuclease superfamily protein n=1 Tax=Aedoeadaptatus ivorii TaxID=54006 RepID=A0A3S4ZRI7_9FIRM|nr:GIY-YIG nuclease family protein [Peptoniphilus ivorii]MDQ0508655.1 putative endonuclease [Peptoniphilus ivorii]VEJ36220.1 GIY-YIG nuclease superfamily protein [Peptoniphilus ivorii]